ncbi:MAG: MATE family efflux transporter [Lachnospiraceae bacterium]|nr:MATE family efflux transporter [Lachnospiraceae bacterium]
MFDAGALKQLILPLLLEQILVMLVGLVDTVMVSKVGESAVSGVSLVDMINQLIFTILAALATGGAVVTSQYIGKKEKEKACSTANQLLYVLLFAALVVLVVSLLFARPILSVLFGAIEDDVMSAAMAYFIISALSYPFLAAYNAGAALFRSMSNSKVTLKMSILMNVLNVIGNTIFIFGLNMGVAGAALGSLLGRASAAVAINILLADKKNIIHYSKPQKPYVDWDDIKRILYIGIPNGLENGIFQMGRIIVVSIIALFGTTQIAANAVANNFDGIGIIPGNAMMLAMITVVGQCVGAGEYKQAAYYTKLMTAVTYITFVFWDGFLIATLPWTIQVYNLSEETLELAKLLITIHCGMAVVLWPMSFVVPNALRAASDVRFTMIVSITSMIVFRVLFSVILGIHFGMGAIGVWIAMIIDWVCRSVFFVGRFKSGKWKLKKLV